MIDILLARSPEHPASAALTLPASKYDRMDASARLGVNDLSKAHIQFGYERDIPNIIRTLKTAFMQKPSFNELNFLAARLAALSEQEKLLMDGLAYIHDPETIKDLINMTYNLENVMAAGEIETTRQPAIARGGDRE